MDNPAPTRLCMASITTIPNEVLLKVTKVSDLRTAIRLLSTCKPLYGILHHPLFWIDQLHRLYWLFQPQMPLHLESLPVQELKELATTPYRFEHRAIRGELSNLPLSLVNLGVGYRNITAAKLVPGGKWLITLSQESEDVQQDDADPDQMFVRLWRISSPGEENINCVARFELPANISPNEACLQHGDDDLELLVFVAAFQLEADAIGGYIKVFRVQLGDKNPQFSLVADLEMDSYCTGLTRQNGTINVAVHEIQPARVDGMNWNWRTGAKAHASGLEPGGTNPCYIVISEPLSVTWNAIQCTIDVRWSPTSDRPGEVGRHVPGPSEFFPNILPNSQIFPVLDEIRTPHGDTRQIAVINLERESILVEVEELGTGNISFTRYEKDNSYMEDPHDPTSANGHPMERPYGIVQTVNGHLIDMAPSGRFNMFLAPASDHRARTEIGQSCSWSAYGCHAFIQAAYPLMCPFTGVVGYITSDGELFIWRMSEENI